MAFDGASDRYLTCVPVEALRQQALVRTWPAREPRRPGSVWSHVLLIDFVDLGEIESLRGLLGLFRKPDLDSEGEPRLDPYRTTIPWSGVPRTPSSRRATELGDDLLILWAAYGNSASAVIRADDPAALETALIEVWEQQWPRVRRSFSFRTRYRVSAHHASTFAVQVVERLERDQKGIKLPERLPAWVDRLARDLAVPDEELRSFLRRYGAESGDWRAELGPLIEIQGMLDTGTRATVPTRVWEAFPGGGEMRALKRALFGRADEYRDLWLAPEHERLREALQADPPTAADLEDLEVSQRLNALWGRTPRLAAKLVAFTYRDGAGLADDLLVRSTTQHAQGEEIATLADAQPALALSVIEARLDLLSAPALWMGPPSARGLVADLLGQADQRVRENVLLALLRSDSVDAACGVVQQEPQLWWRALQFEAERLEAAPYELERGAHRLRRLLEAAGPAAIGSRPVRLASIPVLKLLAVTFPPQAGLWRQATAQQWVGVAQDLGGIQAEGLRLRALVVLLSATRLAATPLARRQLWLATFAPLHAALHRDQLRSPDADALDALLPPGNNGDRCDRLRRGAAQVIVRDKWPPQDAQAIVDGAHPFESHVLAVLKLQRKKPKGWLRELLDYLTP
jgi:hypothetical protein